MRLRGKLILPTRIINGEVQLHHGRIIAVHRRRTGGRYYIAPGFIDLHLWGEPERLTRREPRGGTTAFVATIGPLAPQRLQQRLAGWSALTRLRGAQLLGFHLEGQWVNPRQAGALSLAGIRWPTIRECTRLWDVSQRRIRLVTLAPEMPGATAAIRFWSRRGVAVSYGHTAASYDAAKRGIAAGVHCATHLWNKMGSPHQRRPGTIGACLEDPRVMAMLLVDGKHLHPTTVKLLYRLLGPERLVLVTDSTRALAVSDDPSFGLRRGQFRGKLAGTRLTMIAAVKHLRQFTDATLPAAVRTASLNPARVLGLAQRKGSLTVGKDADLVVFDRRLRVQQTIVGGRIIYRRR